MEQEHVAGSVETRNQPPDPSEAAAAKRETQRRLDMSRGVVAICTGGWGLAMAAVSLLYSGRVPGENVMLWCFGVLVLGIVVPMWLRRVRRHAGIPVGVAKGELSLKRPMRRVEALAMLAGVVFVVASAGLLSILPRMAARYTSGTTLGAVCLLMLIPLAWRGLRLHLWEHLFLAASFVISGVILVFLRDSNIGWALGTLGAGGLIAGLSLHLRWRRWVRSLPKEGTAANGENSVGETTASEGPA